MGITSFTLNGLGVNVPASDNVARTVPCRFEEVKGTEIRGMRQEAGHGRRGGTGTILAVVPSVTDARREEVPVELMIAVPLVLLEEPLDLAALEGQVQAWG